MLELPVHISLGPIVRLRIYLSVGLEKTVVPLELSAAIQRAVGTTHGQRRSAGRAGESEFSKQRRQPRPVQLDIGFKPPNGVGLAVDAGVKGGGYLYLDPDAASTPARSS